MAPEGFQPTRNIHCRVVQHHQGRRRRTRRGRAPAQPRREERLLASILVVPKRLLLPPPPQGDSSRHRISKWFTAASDKGRLVRMDRRRRRIPPCPRRPTPWVCPYTPMDVCHAWMDGSFRESAGPARSSLFRGRASWRRRWDLSYAVMVGVFVQGLPSCLKLLGDPKLEVS